VRRYDFPRRVLLKRFALDVQVCQPLARLIACALLVLPAATRAQPADETTQGGLLAEEKPPEKPGIAYYEALVQKAPTEPSGHQLLAAAYGRQGRVDDARRAARRAIELAPTVAEYHQTLGLIEEGADNLVAAEAAFKKAASLDGNVEFRLDVARVLWRLDRRAEAEAAWAAVAADFADNRDVQLAVANSFHGLGKNEEALAIFERAIALSKSGAERADVLVEIARVHADRGATATALESLVRARDAAPTDPDIHYNLGVLYFRAGQQDAAVAAFDAAVKLKADHANALNNKGVVLEKQRRLEDAVKAFEAAIAVDPKNGFAHFNRGLALFKLRRFKDAEGAFERAVEVNPEIGEARFFLGEIYFQLGDSKKALRLYKDALHSNPDDAATHRRVGDIHLQNRDLDLAIGEYWAAVDADKASPDHRAQLMRVLVARNGDGDVRRAVKLGEEGLKSWPDQLEVRLALATAEVANRRSEKARRLLEEGTRVAPGDPRTHTAYGRFLLEQGNVADAEASFIIAARLDPRYAPAIAGQGDAALSQGDNARAETLFRQALDIDPTLATARAELGYILFKAEKNAAALKELSRAVEDDPGLGRGWFYLAFARFNSGARDKAEEAFKRAVAVQPDLAEAWLHLGRLHRENGKKEEAKAAFPAAEQARGGTYPEARLELERLQ
jgi:tetratricopeptide (TPR) repeat protein